MRVTRISNICELVKVIAIFILANVFSTTHASEKISIACASYKLGQKWGYVNSSNGAVSRLNHEVLSVEKGSIAIQTKQLTGLPPSGNKVEVAGLEVLERADGMIAVTSIHQEFFGQKNEVKLDPPQPVCGEIESVHEVKTTVGQKNAEIVTHTQIELISLGKKEVIVPAGKFEAEAYQSIRIMKTQARGAMSMKMPAMRMEQNFFVVPDVGLVKLITKQSNAGMELISSQELESYVVPD